MTGDWWFSSVAQSCLTICGPMEYSNWSIEPTQTHVHLVSDAIQPSHTLLSLLPPAIFPSIRIFQKSEPRNQVVTASQNSENRRKEESFYHPASYSIMNIQNA